MRPQFTCIILPSNMYKSNLVFAFFYFALFSAMQAQQKDTIPVESLDDVIIRVSYSVGGIDRMPDIKDNVIYAGKKTEVIRVNSISADLSTNNTRQIFAKVPGMSIWENDGSGIQAGVAARGLSPNRSWEFNVRQNGYDISSEVFGYPETYYTPPMEAVEKIEVVRGAASLQYGPQFGGLINYQIKKANPNKFMTFETNQTMGSYGLFNTYNALGGTDKKFSYYGFLHHRSAEGWRSNSRYNIYTAYLSASYQVSKRLLIEGEYTNMNYKSQQSGGLSDQQFQENHRQSLRERNWFGAPFNVASITFKYEITSNINLQVKSFATIAARNSVGFLSPITTKDSINATTLQYNPRQVDRDKYNNYGAEARVSYQYYFLEQNSIFAGGIRVYSGNTKRNQQGIGTNGNNFDLSLTNPQYGRSLSFSTSNYAAFAENIFQIGKRLKIVPGIRLEYIKNTVEGYINTSSTGVLNTDKRTRQIFLYGLGSEYKLTKETNLYANYSRSYRPVTFSELTPLATTEVIDPNLKDASGFNADFGYRGDVGSYLNFDVGLFYLNYKNRIGTITQNGLPYKTNIGTSVSKGIESYIELSVMRLFTQSTKWGIITVFTSNAFIDAKYVTWNNPSIANDPIKSIEGKRVENAPNYIHRLGASYAIRKFSASIQFNKVGDVFTDAANTEMPNSAATIGKLEGYQLIDVSFSYRFMRDYLLKIGINNLTDEKYATRRAGGYPGPGILPGNGRTIFVSIGGKF